MVDFNESDNNQAIDYLYKLLNLAKGRTVRLGTSFKKEDYKWVLGAHVINDIRISNVLTAWYPDQKMTLFGIVVEADYRNPDNVQLWEDITDKVGL